MHFLRVSGFPCNPVASLFVMQWAGPEFRWTVDWENLMKEKSHVHREKSSAAGGGRWSAKRKTSVVLELLRGADLEATSRKQRVTVATLTQWRTGSSPAAKPG